MAACKACEAPILWASSALTGRPMPLNPKPIDLPVVPVDQFAPPRGTFAVVKGAAHAYTREDFKLKRDAHTSHFASCPNADEFRGGDR